MSFQNWMSSDQLSDTHWIVWTTIRQPSDSHARAVWIWHWIYVEVQLQCWMIIFLLFCSYNFCINAMYLGTVIDPSNNSLFTCLQKHRHGGHRSDGLVVTTLHSLNDGSPLEGSIGAIIMQNTTIQMRGGVGGERERGWQFMLCKSFARKVKIFIRWRYWRMAPLE